MYICMYVYMHTYMYIHPYTGLSKQLKNGEAINTKKLCKSLMKNMEEKAA